MLKTAIYSYISMMRNLACYAEMDRKFQQNMDNPLVLKPRNNNKNNFPMIPYRKTRIEIRKRKLKSICCIPISTNLILQMLSQ